LKRKAFSMFLFVFLLLSSLILVSSIRPVNAASSTVYVDDDNVYGPWDGSFTNPYRNITSGLKNAASGDTIFVYSGIYRENVSIEKSISLLGQDPFTTIIDGVASDYHFALQIFNTTDVFVQSFTVKNTTAGNDACGILIHKCINATIQNVIVTEAYYGILISNSTQCKVMDNTVTDDYNAGIVFRSNSSHNMIIGNLISVNPMGIYVESYSQHNVFYRNNLVNNTFQFKIFPPTYSSWDNGAEGNYWNDYKGLDNGSAVRMAGDGVGDTMLPHQGVDNYPLIEPWNKTRTYTVGFYKVVVNCNYTVASFVFNESMRQISFYITGPAGWRGYCNITIPKGLLSPSASERWLVFLGDPIAYTNQTIGNSTLVSFKYTLGASMGENRVRVIAGVLYPPTVNFEFVPDPASTIAQVNFTNTSKEGNGTIVWQQWSFGDGTPPLVTNVTFVSHQFSSKALFNVTLTVRDENNLTDSLRRTVWVSNINPSADFTFSPIEPFVGSEVVFNASMSEDLDGNIVEYRWDFGDDNVANSITPIIVHKFATSFPYKVNLTVVDSDGATDRKTRLVIEGKGPSSIEIDSPASVKVKEPFIVNATLTDDSSQPLLDEQIEFHVYGDGLVLSRDVTTGIGGVATATFSVNSFGEYTVGAIYRGSEDYLESNVTTSITVNLLNTTLILQAQENVTQNEALTMSATLVDEQENPLYNATIEFYFHNGSAWESLGSSKTNQGGVASFSYVPQKTGTFMLKAVFNGTETYASSNVERSLLVTAPQADYTPYIILAVILTAAVCLVLVIWRRRKTTSKTQRKG